MKTKLLTILSLLVMCVTGAWAQTTYTYTGYSTQIVNGWTHNYGDTYVGRKGSNYTPENGGLPTGNSNIFAAFQVTSTSKIKVTFVWTKTNGDLSGKSIALASIDKNTYDKLALASTATTNEVKYSIDNFSSSQSKEVAINRSNANTEIDFEFDNAVNSGYYVVYTANSINASALIKKITVTPKASYSVTYNPNNGTEEADVTDNAASTVADCPNTWTVPTNKLFSGWNTAADGSGDAYAVGAAVTSTLTLYAQWADAYTVTFNLQGHGSAIAAQNIVSGGKVTEPATPTADDGYLFRGWYKESACTNAWDFDNDVVSAATELFAKWVEATTLFSMTDITGPSESLSKGDVADVEATFTQGGSAEVFQNASSGTMFFNNNSINLNGSGGSYLHVIFPNNVILQAGDVIDAELLTGALKVSASTSSASSITLPYTIKTTDTNLIGATGLYFFKDESAQVTSLTIKGQGAISDFAITSSTTPTVAIGNESTITYTSSSTGAVTFTSSDNAVASITDGGVITAKEGGTATITINQDADETYRAALAKITVTVPEVVFVKIKTLGGSSTKVTGTMDVTTGITADVNLSSNRKMDKGKYVGFTLNGENAIQTGDIIEVKLSAAGQGGKFIFYDSKGDNPTVLYNTNVSPDEAKVYRFVVPAAMNGVKTTYLRRGGDDSGINEGFNPFFEYIAICRPSGEITLNASGYATYSSATNFLISGAKAYKATLNTADKEITCTEVEAVPAGAGVLLFGDAGAKVAIINTTSADALTDNDLKGTTQADGTLATFDTAKYYYALSGDTFKHYTGAAFAANKAYLESVTELSSKLSLIFDDGETTTIDNLTISQSDKNAQMYNLSGQKVNESYKGIVIVSGKKYINK
jgi:hypothetical protein